MFCYTLYTHRYNTHTGGKASSTQISVFRWAPGGRAQPGGETALSIGSRAALQFIDCRRAVQQRANRAPPCICTHRRAALDPPAPRNFAGPSRTRVPGSVVVDLRGQVSDSEPTTPRTVSPDDSGTLNDAVLTLASNVPSVFQDFGDKDRWSIEDVSDRLRIFCVYRGSLILELLLFSIWLRAFQPLPE